MSFELKSNPALTTPKSSQKGGFPWRRIAFVLLPTAVLAPTLRAADESSLLSGGILDILQKGGPVMIVILLGSIIGLAVAIERFVALQRKNLLPKDVLDSVRVAKDAGRIESLAQSLSGRTDPLSRILLAGVNVRDQGASYAEKTMESVGSREVARLKRPVRSLAILATVEPLLGLLGTVTGMIGTFNVLHQSSAADRVEKLAPGIGQALYTTVGGLCAAIPFVIVYHFLVGRVHQAAEQWSSLGSDVVLCIAKPTARSHEAAP